MIVERRLQWHIAWTKWNLSSLVYFWSFAIVVVLSFASPKMGYSVRKDYLARKHYAWDYIPFDKVLKRNFILSE